RGDTGQAASTFQRLCVAYVFYLFEISRKIVLTSPGAISVATLRVSNPAACRFTEKHSFPISAGRAALRRRGIVGVMTPPRR
ncbi:hypothetical protein, partial [uncultured Desulfovibrio sp.]|uniref:hypothetical protein n=1 Tax=uncultured Desulfovibrio sp. TaxID=167968 RepID=UPI00262CB7C1